MQISFAGSTIKRPGAYSTVDTANMTPTTPGSFNVLAFVGAIADATATLAPATPYYFNDPVEARKKIKSGEMLDMMNVAWQHGADLIGVVRADVATRATGTIKDATTVTVITLNAKDYGTDGNAVQYQFVTPNITIKNATITETYSVTGKTNQQIVDEINAKSVLAVAVYAAAAAPGNPAALTNMAGGAAGATPLDTDWQTAIDALAGEFVDAVIPVTATATIHTKVDAHVTSMSSTINRRERRAFYGHAVGESISAVTTRQATLAVERGLMATPTVFYPDASGNLVERPSYYLAAAYAGVWASQPPQEPITYKYVKFPKLGKIYNGTDIQTLLDGHIAPVEYVRGKGFRIVQGVTLSASSDLTQQELSVSTLKDVMSRNIRDYFENKYVGHAGVAGIEITMTNDLISMIEKFKTANWITGYVPESVKVTKSGTAFIMDWQGVPTLPINNFLITSHFTL